jgi:FkbH-like protein
MTAENSVALIPTALAFPTSSPPKYALALLGTCIAEGFAKSNSASGWKVDHFLMHSRPESGVPLVPWDTYDAVVVHVTLRQLLLGLVADGDDLVHVRTVSNYNDLVIAAADRLNRVIERVTDSVGRKTPIFFLSFLEPPNTYQGILINNRQRSLYHLVRCLNDEMAGKMDSGKATYYIELNDLTRYYGDSDLYDGYVSHFTHAGILGSSKASKFISATLKRISGALSILRSEDQVKLIISDLDNTLWNGVLAEFDEIIPHQHYEGWPLGYAEALLEFKRRGGLLAISSKNDYARTIDRFNLVWRNRLRVDDFCCLRINWEIKSRNIAEILEETNIMPSNTLFIDDNAREIEEVRRVFPQMRFLTGRQQDWRSLILFSPQTQVCTISQESTSRTEMIREKLQRNKIASELSHNDYLFSLKIRVKFDKINDTLHNKFERAFELLNKTNQFNTIGKRWKLAELNDLFLTGGQIIALTSSDNIGDNGLVALAIIKNCDVLQVVVSCRVFGFGLETALLCEVINVIRIGRDCKTVVGHFQDTHRNKTCASFFKNNGFSEAHRNPGVWCMETMPTWPSWISKM